MTRERGPYWWDEYRDSLPTGLLDIAEMEHYAAALRSAQIMHMPGILQTPDYMRGIFAEAVPSMDPADLERHVEFRVRRAALLDRSEPPSCESLIHETVLRMRYGDRKVLRRQLDHLLEQAERPSITARVVPFSAGALRTPAVRRFTPAGRCRSWTRCRSTYRPVSPSFMPRPTL
nr:DUF5753 domain-containing protein [Streptomyces sp. SA15]